MARIQYQPASRSRGFKPRNLSTAGINRMREESNRIIDNMEKNREAEKAQRDRELQAMKEDNLYEEQIERENFDTKIQNLQTERNQTVTGIQLEGAEAQAQQAKTQAILQSISSLSNFASQAVTAIDADLLKQDVAKANDALRKTPEAQINYDEAQSKAQQAQITYNVDVKAASFEPGGSQIEAAKAIASGPVLTGRAKRIYNEMLYERDYKALYGQYLSDPKSKFTAADGTTFFGPEARTNASFAEAIQFKLREELDERFNVTDPRAYSKAFKNINDFNAANLTQVRAAEYEQVVEIGMENARTLLYGGGNPATYDDAMQASQTVIMFEGFPGLHDFLKEAAADVTLNDETRDLIGKLEFNGELISERSWWAGALAEHSANQTALDTATDKQQKNAYQANLLDNYESIYNAVQENPLYMVPALEMQLQESKYPIPPSIKALFTSALKRGTEDAKLLIDNQFGNGAIDITTVNSQATAALRSYAADKLEEWENVKYGEDYGTFKKALLGSVKKLFSTDKDAPVDARMAAVGMLASEYYDDLVQNQNLTPEIAAKQTSDLISQAKAGRADNSNPFYSVSGEYNTRTYPATITDPVYAAQKINLLNERLLIDQRNIVDKPYYINTEPELEKVIKSFNDGAFRPTREMIQVAEDLDVKVSEVVNEMRKSYNLIDGTNKPGIQLSPAVQLVDAARGKAAELLTSIYSKRVERGGAPILGDLSKYQRLNTGAINYPSIGGNYTPQEKAFIDTISQSEGAGFNTVYGGAQVPQLTQMTLGELYDAIREGGTNAIPARLGGGIIPFKQDKYNSSASGFLQIMPETLLGMINSGKYSEDDIFTPKVQISMALDLAKERGIDVNNLTEEGMRQAGGIWASLTPQYGQTTTTAGESFQNWQQNLNKYR